jgi:hypothetical protein
MSTYRFGDALPGFLTTTPWQCKLAEAMFNDTGDTTLKSFFGAQGWNVSLIDDLHKFSKADLLPGADRVTYMKANVNVSEEVVNSFLNHIAEYEGSNVKEGIGNFVNNILNAAENAGKGIGDTAKSLPVIVGILAIGVAGYLIFAGKKGTKLTPF